MAIFVKPGVGRRVFIPGKKHVAIPEAGTRVDLTPFMQRRLDCGDLVQITEAELAANVVAARKAQAEAADAARRAQEAQAAQWAREEAEERVAIAERQAPKAAPAVPVPASPPPAAAASPATVMAPVPAAPTPVAVKGA